MDQDIDVDILEVIALMKQERKKSKWGQISLGALVDELLEKGKAGFDAKKRTRT